MSCHSFLKGVSICRERMQFKRKHVRGKFPFNMKLHFEHACEFFTTTQSDWAKLNDRKYPQWPLGGMAMSVDNTELGSFLLSAIREISQSK